MSKKQLLTKNKNWVYFIFFTSWVFVLMLSSVESITYKGFIQNHFHIPLKSFLYLTFFLGAVSLFVNFEIFKPNLFVKMDLIALLFSTLCLYVLKSMELSNYPNYIYSKFHINLVGVSSFTVPLFYILLLYVIAFVWRMLVKNKEKISFVLFYKALVLLVVGGVLITNSLKLPDIFARELVFMITNPRATYDQKMGEELGNTFYNFVLFVRNNTPTNSKILIPPFAAFPWPQTGNYVYMRYFLYPREVVNGLEYSADHDLAKEKIKYVLIAWGETPTTSGSYTHGWPKFDVKANHIIFWNKDGSSKKISEDYIYNKVKGKELWGLMEVTNK